MNDVLLLLLVFSPLAGMLLLLFIKSDRERFIKWIGAAATVPALLISLYVYVQFQAGERLGQYDIRLDWFRFGNFEQYDPNLYAVRFELGVDGLSLVMLLLTSLLCTLAAIASMQIKKEWKGYFLLFLTLEIGMLGVFASENLILFFLFFEVTLISMFFLIGKWGYGRSGQAAYSFLIYNGLGSAVLLIVIMILFAKTGTSNIAVLQQVIPNGGATLIANISPELKYGLLLALLVAFGIKLPIFPFHTWMLHVHVQAPPPIVMLHAGVLLKIGAFGLIRFGIGIFPEQFSSLSVFFIILGLINLLFGAFLAFVQDDFKMVLAYSSVSHMGIVLLGLGAQNEAGLQGAIFQVVSHGLIAALLFFLVGLLYERTNTTALSKLGGMAKTVPIISGFLLAGCLASLGLPGMSGFVSEFMAFLGVFEQYPLYAIVGTLGLIMTAVYMLRAVLAITFGESKNDTARALADVKGTEWTPLVVLTGCIILIGIYPSLLQAPLQETISIFITDGGG
ncbi:MAG: NuoM family protein [Bacillus sp. (in: firmicutes)]